MNFPPLLTQHPRNDALGQEIDLSCTRLSWKMDEALFRLLLNLSSILTDKGEKFITGLGVIPEHTKHGRGHRTGSPFFYSSRLHAHVATYVGR